MTPIMGLSGMDSWSFHTSLSPSIAHRCVLHTSKRSPHTPSSLPVHDAVCGSSSMFSMVTFSAPPGTAPSTNTGPVAGLMRSQLISSSSSSGVCTWFPKQSCVRMRTVSPDATVSAGSKSRANANSTRSSLSSCMRPPFLQDCAEVNSTTEGAGSAASLVSDSCSKNTTSNQAGGGRFREFTLRPRNLPRSNPARGRGRT